MSKGVGLSASPIRVNRYFCNEYQISTFKRLSCDAEVIRELVFPHHHSKHSGSTRIDTPALLAEWTVCHPEMLYAQS